LLSLHFFCGLCALSLVVDYRIKVKLDLFVLQELGKDFEKISLSKMRVRIRISWWARKDKLVWWA